MWCVWYLEHLQIMRNIMSEKASELPELDSPATPGLSSEARERIKKQLIANKP
jgi:hypothetical protein